MPKATLYWAIGRRSWACHQLERLRASPRHRVNVVDEEIAAAEAVLAEAERLIGELEA
jgi:hypothetical protein